MDEGGGGWMKEEEDGWMEEEDGWMEEEEYG
jgi:hypothetical protein